MPRAGGPPPIDFRALCDQTNVRNFNCGERELDRWFSKNAHRDHKRGTVSVTCGFLDTATFQPAGFYAVATVAEEVTKLPGSHYHRFGQGHHFSCLQLVWLATRRTLRGQGIGSVMVGRVVELFAQIGPLIGLPHLIVVPLNRDLIPFYRELGFEEYDRGARMFLPIQSAIDATSI